LPFDPTETLAQLVAIASVNPMGRATSEPPFGEARLTDYLEQTFRRLGLAVERQRVAPDRDNLIARLDGHLPPQRGGPVILLDAHQDTVSADGMTIAPFTPEIRQGRLYGRGSCDVKGGMAAILSAVARLADERPAGMATVLVSCTVNEEDGFSGARALAEFWSDPSRGIIPRPPDAAVVAEPTGLDVVIAHKGIVRWKCQTHGRAAHSAHPERGDNAIYKMARVVSTIERYARTILGTTQTGQSCDADLGPATLNVGTIHGGSGVNTVPDRCAIEIDRRLLPGEQPEQARRQLIDYLAASDLGFDIEHGPPYAYGPALAAGPNRAPADRLRQIAGEVAGRGRQRAVRYATNAALFAEAGVASVVFGPGCIDQAHTEDEWIELDQVRLAAEIYYRLCLEIEAAP